MLSLIAVLFPLRPIGYFWTASNIYFLLPLVHAIVKLFEKEIGKEEIRGSWLFPHTWTVSMNTVACQCLSVAIYITGLWLTATPQWSYEACSIARRFLWDCWMIAAVLWRRIVQLLGTQRMHTTQATDPGAVWSRDYPHPESSPCYVGSSASSPFLPTLPFMQGAIFSQPQVQCG